VATILPNLIVIGAQDAGIALLCQHLAAHPDVELRADDSRFFTSDRSWSRSIEGYRALFEGRARIAGECAPSCTRFPHVDGVPARIRAALPDVRLLYLMCDPLERIVASWLRRVELGRERRSFRAAIASVRDNPYVDASRYHLQLEQFWKHFPASQIHVMVFEELRRTPRQALLGVWEFLDLDPAACAGAEPTLRTEPARETGPRWLRAATWLRRALGTEIPAPVRPPIGVDLRAQLERALAGDLAKLRAATGLALADWSL
jgi:sulfotransferase family protein